MLVASFTDAWIETSASSIPSGLYLSHLLQMRGLKPCKKRNRLPSFASHLLQMRGLKQAA